MTQLSLEAPSWVENVVSKIVSKPVELQWIDKTPNSTKPVLCTKQPKFTVLFYHKKVPATSSPGNLTLPFTGATCLMIKKCTLNFNPS